MEQQMTDQQTVLASSLMGAKPRKKPCANMRRKKEPWTEGALQTEYQKEYWEKKAPHERTAPIQPRSQLGPDGPFDGTTSYNTNFRAPDGSSPAQPFKPALGEKENLPFSPWTTYKVDYPAKEVPYSRVRPVGKLQPSSGPFEDSTTMKESYPGWAGAKPTTPAQGRSVSVPRGVGPFEGVSAYKDDYRRWPGARPPAAAPLLGGRAALPGGSFNDCTTHRSTYTPKQVGPQECVRHADQTSKPEGWYDGPPSTEYRRHYIEKAGRPQPRAAATVGASGAALPKGPFSGATTYGTEFRPRTAPEYERAGRPADDARETGPFQGLSTYKDSFVKKNVPYQRVRPSNKLSPSAGPFEDSTEMKTNFQNWGAQPVTRAGPSTSANLATIGPFDGTTTYRTDFHKMTGGLRASGGRPTSGTRALQPRGPFDGVSMYTTDYIPKPYEPVQSYKPCECEGPDCEGEEGQ